MRTTKGSKRTRMTRMSIGKGRSQEDGDLLDAPGGNLWGELGSRLGESRRVWSRLE